MQHHGESKESFGSLSIPGCSASCKNEKYNFLGVSEDPEPFAVTFRVDALPARTPLIDQSVALFVDFWLISSLFFFLFFLSGKGL